MSKIILLLIVLIVSTFSLMIPLVLIVTAINENDLLSILIYCFMLSVVLVILIGSVVAIFKL
jgi:hypothetical protein|nr:MAG TPA: hypothetical protein [Caudoviricetes sp.]